MKLKGRFSYFSDRFILFILMDSLSSSCSFVLQRCGPGVFGRVIQLDAFSAGTYIGKNREIFQKRGNFVYICDRFLQDDQTIAFRWTLSTSVVSTFRSFAKLASGIWSISTLLTTHSSTKTAQRRKLNLSSKTKCKKSSNLKRPFLFVF